MKLTALLPGLLVATLFSQTISQTVKSIPVYPGAKLVVEKEEGVEPECCGFRTNDPYEKVLSFYEAQLKTKAMDIKTIAAKYPAMKQQLQQLEKQMPPTMKYRAFVVAEMVVNGQQGATLFEVIGNPNAVNFTIPQDAFSEADAQFPKEWRQRTGSLTEQQIAQKEATEREEQATRDEKQFEAEGKAKEEKHNAEMAALFEKTLTRNNVKIYPGSRFLEHFVRSGSEGEQDESTLYVRYAVLDGFKKVYDFYASQMVQEKVMFRPSHILDEQGQRTETSTEVQFHWRNAPFVSECVELRLEEVSSTEKGPKQVYLEFAVEQKCQGFEELRKAEKNFGHFR